MVATMCTGDVILKQTWEKCIKPDGAYEGRPIKDKDVIELETGRPTLGMERTVSQPALGSP
jgi:nitric oxide synthase-interacting protein